MFLFCAIQVKNVFCLINATPTLYYYHDRLFLGEENITRSISNFFMVYAGQFHDNNPNTLDILSNNHTVS